MAATAPCSQPRRGTQVKVEDVPDEWVAAAEKAGRYNIHHAEIRRFIAAVAPLIRRAALEEAAGVAQSEFPEVGAWDYAPGDDGSRDRAEARHEAGKDIAAAIRALT